MRTPRMRCTVELALFWTALLILIGLYVHVELRSRHDGPRLHISVQAPESNAHPHSDLRA